MKNLIPLMALLVLGGCFTPALADEECKKDSKGGDECCKDGAKAKHCHKSAKHKVSTKKHAAEKDAKDAPAEAAK